MNNNEKYFIALINSHLNNTAPPEPVDVDFNEIYRLANINNIIGIVSSEVSGIKDISSIDNGLLSKFRQQIGFTVINSAEKEASVSEITQILKENEIEYLFIKGEIIKRYYPTPALRVSADTDIIVRDNDLGKIKDILIGKNYKIFDEKDVGFSAWINKKNVEFHSEKDYDNKYFESIFDLCTNDGLEYKIDDYNHLLYVLCHIIKHFKYCGAGIKMFMDVDVLIRHIDNFDYDKFIKMCIDCGIESFSKITLSICNLLFNTPVKAEIDFEENIELKEMFEDEIINAGTFGFEKRDLGSFYAISSSKDGEASKSRAMRQFLFPKKEQLQKRYSYLEDKPYLLPIAWGNRAFNGVFKRGKHSVDTINMITNSNDDTYAKLLNELDI